MRVPRWREASPAIKLGKPNSFWVLLSTWSFVHNHSGLRAVHLSAQCSIAVRAKACEIVTRGGGPLSWSGTVHTMWNRSANMAVWMNMKKWGRSSSDERSDKMGCMTKVLTFFFFQRAPPPFFSFCVTKALRFDRDEVPSIPCISRRTWMGINRRSSLQKTMRSILISFCAFCVCPCTLFSCLRNARLILMIKICRHRISR